MPNARTSSVLLAACALALGACSSGSSEPKQPPEAPAGLVATPYNGAVGLAWSPSAGAATYSVHAADTSGLAPEAMALVASGLGGTTFNAPAANGVIRYFRVTAVNSAGSSPGSNEASATPLATLAPAAPTGVSAAAGDGSVTISWDPVPGADDYVVYWSTAPGVTTGSSSLTATAGSAATHGGLVNGTTYWYAVTSRIGTVNESALSAEVAATPAARPYIDASAMMVAGVGNQYSVNVCTSSSCTTPITDAIVTMGGVPLPWNGTDAYEAQPTGSIAGASIEVAVTIRAGSAVLAGTYRASGTVYTKAPSLTSPTSGATWQASQANDLTWTAGAPTAASLYSYAIFNMGLGTDFFFGFTPPPATSATVPANTLTAGSHITFVAIGPTAAIPIPGALPGSGFTIAASSNYAIFSVQ
jgi:hypothetical protein